MLRKVLLAITATLVVVAVILAVSGGFRTTVGGFRISARSPLAASIAALIAGAAWFALARRHRAIAADLEAAWQALERHASQLIGVVALISAIVAATFATRSAAGADASGYLTQAEIWHQGRFFLRNELSLELAGTAFDWPHEHHWITTPLGWRPAAVPGMHAPTYPPGLPILMAFPQAVAGIDGAVAVIVASAAIAVWASGIMIGGLSGVIAALLLASTPAFLFQSIQPMSDVPVTAAWMLCFLLLTRTQRSFEAGLVCAAAVLIRPNLAPLAVVPLLIAQGKVRFAAPVVFAGLFLAFMQDLWYGSPFRSGYGSADELFSLANVGSNAIRYFSWLIATAPVLFLAVFGVIRLKRDGHARALLTFAMLVIVSYLVYAVFDQWSYLRFLLPAIAVLTIFAGVGLAGWIGRWPVAVRFPIVFALMLGVTGHALFVARTFETFRLADQLRRVEQVGEFVHRTAPQNAVLIAGEQSGSMTYYTLRSILRWEAATPDNLAKALAALEETKRPIYVVLDAWENELFFAKFKDLPAVALDWPPLVDAGTSHRTKVWRLSDRARFLNGENLSTVRLP